MFLSSQHYCKSFSPHRINPPHTATAARPTGRPETFPPGTHPRAPCSCTPCTAALPLLPTFPQALRIQTRSFHQQDKVRDTRNSDKDLVPLYPKEPIPSAPGQSLGFYVLEGLPLVLLQAIFETTD